MFTLVFTMFQGLHLRCFFQVRILYIRNLMLDTSEEKIEMLCNQALKKADAIERVKKLRDYAFVHFKERSDAIAAMKELNGW